MPSAARILSTSGIYHIMFREIDHQDICEEAQDFACMLSILKDELHFEMQAYCLMPNHAQLLLQERMPEEVLMLVKRL